MPTQSNLDTLNKRQVRYLCFRLQTEALGGSKATKEKNGIMSFVDEIKDHMESQDDFGGWPKFAKTWDVDEKSPLVTVKRSSSIQTEWNKVLREEAKELPIAAVEVTGGKKKLLQNALGKKIQKRKEEVAQQTSLPPRGPGGKFISLKKSFWG